MSGVGFDAPVEDEGLPKVIEREFAYKATTYVQWSAMPHMMVQGYTGTRTGEDYRLYSAGQNAVRRLWTRRAGGQVVIMALTRGWPWTECLVSA